MRFNPVFLFIMATAALASVVLPRGLADRVRGGFDNVLLPVAYPVGAMSGALRSHFESASPALRDASGHVESDSDLQREVEKDRVLIASLDHQVEDLNKLLAETRSLGEIGKYCRKFTVWGADAGTRQTLSLTGSKLDGLADGMLALNSYGIVGRVISVGVAGARVQLVTDSGFVVSGSIRRYYNDAKQHGFSRVDTPPFTVSGDGHGAMVISNLKQTDVSALRIGDWVDLSDHDFPDVAQGWKLGEIVSIAPQPRNALFVDIVVRPSAATDLLRLRDVMVVMRKAAP